MSHQVREVFLCPAEVDDAGDEYGQRDCCRDAKACIVYRDVSEEDGTVRVEESGEGFSERSHCRFSPMMLAGYMTGETNMRSWTKNGRMNLTSRYFTQIDESQ